MNKIITIRRFHLIAVVIICVLSGYIFGTNKVTLGWKNYHPIVSVSSKNPPPGQNIDMSMFYRVLDQMTSNYYDKSKLDNKKILYGAIAGMIQSLNDPFTSFFPPQQNQDFKSQMSGQFSGIGAELGVSNGHITITAPLEGSPAEKAGIKIGDYILKVNDQDISGWTLAQAVEKIRGPKGTSIKLTILHHNDKAPIDLSIVRDNIQVKSVTGWLKEVSCEGNSCTEQTNCTTCASIAYIRLSEFGDNTNDEWIAKVNELLPKIQAEKNFKGIILDVRDNPGGYLNDAVFIASEFIKDGTVVMQEDAKGDRASLTVSRKGLLTDAPLVVLINKSSASASEIVAGALRDHSRAKLVGDVSFGKGTIQQAEDLGGGAGLHITVAKWLTPNGTWVHQKGLTPDVLVPLDKNDQSHDAQLEKAVDQLVQF